MSLRYCLTCRLRTPWARQACCHGNRAEWCVSKGGYPPSDFTHPAEESAALRMVGSAPGWVSLSHLSAVFLSLLLWRPWSCVSFFFFSHFFKCVLFWFGFTVINHKDVRLNNGPGDSEIKKRLPNSIQFYLYSTNSNQELPQRTYRQGRQCKDPQILVRNPNNYTTPYV